jgi:hypothetical protein
MIIRKGTDASVSHETMRLTQYFDIAFFNAEYQRRGSAVDWRILLKIGLDSSVSAQRL